LTLFKDINEDLKQRAKKIRLVISDSDGVLTDTGVYYSERGEEMKRFSIRDGMGVERLRNICGIESAIRTGELSGSVKKRAEKLGIEELHLGIKDKKKALNEIIQRRKISLENVAYISDDTNDIEVLKIAGLSACPADAVIQIKMIFNFITDSKGGNGAFRDLAELIIAARNDI
jgi:3-deoxy-D-manno-octulosonate 8-phosphate phosphatase (KDO 8-P phosphatase)